MTPEEEQAVLGYSEYQRMKAVAAERRAHIAEQALLTIARTVSDLGAFQGAGEAGMFALTKSLEALAQLGYTAQEVIGAAEV